MAFVASDFILCLSSRTQNTNTGTFTDKTPYGSPNQERASTANYFAIAKMDEKGILSYISGIDNTSVLTSLAWSFNSAKDGAYRAFLFVIPLYDNSATYVKQVVTNDIITQYANIIYHPSSNAFYKAIGTSFSGVEPTVTSGWETSWELHTGDFSSELLSDKIIVHIHDDVVTFKYEDCIIKGVDSILDKELCGVCADMESLLPHIKRELMLDGIVALNWSNRQPDADFTMVEATKKFCC